MRPISVSAKLIHIFVNTEFQLNKILTNTIVNRWENQELFIQHWISQQPPPFHQNQSFQLQPLLLTDKIEVEVEVNYLKVNYEKDIHAGISA